MGDERLSVSYLQGLIGAAMEYGNRINGAGIKLSLARSQGACMTDPEVQAHLATAYLHLRLFIDEIEAAYGMREEQD